MESQSSELRGEGVPTSSRKTRSQSGVVPSAPCRYLGPGGRHCRMLADPGSDLCPHHSHLVHGEDVVISAPTADALLAGVGDFSNPQQVKLFLGNLVTQLIRQRVGRRDAVTMAYLCQLILNSQSAILRDEREAERIEAAKPQPPPKIIWSWDIPKDEPADAGS